MKLKEVFSRSPAVEAAKRLAKLRSEYTPEEIREASIAVTTERIITRFEEVDDYLLI